MVCGGQCEVVVMCSDGGVSGRVFVSIYWDGHGGATMMFDDGGDGSADNDVGLDGGCMLLCLAVVKMVRMVVWGGYSGFTEFGGGGDDVDGLVWWWCVVVVDGGGAYGLGVWGGFIGDDGGGSRVGGGKFGGMSSGGGHDGRRGDSGGLAVVVVGCDVVW
ncbi:Hypothetical predicted protein [Olea europaea subsp. europaea]|uniref:Uncharacterized protein n=1 Tax=Olea europaea subsp. europaea TaxID=158383 RepID=A0A8S0VJ74_OLEEU|nr:Hypothetical predicted protein [Olea europaea subsp. europaea]